MNWTNFTVGTLKRGNSFPFRVQKLFTFNDYAANTPRLLRHRNDFEVTIRIYSDAAVCRDIINGEEQNLPFPNVAYKQPSGMFRICNERAREAIAFAYSAEMLPELRRFGVVPDVSCRSFVMTDELTHLIAEFRRLIANLYSPGVPELLDWTCFQLLGELMFASARAPAVTESRTAVIRNISTWLKMHYSENILLDRVAANYGFSHTTFFREWAKVFDVSPLQYIIDARLDAAAWYLRNSTLPVSRITREVNFSGITHFYRRFHRKFGMTPEAYRRMAEETKLS